MMSFILRDLLAGSTRQSAEVIPIKVDTMRPGQLERVRKGLEYNTSFFGLGVVGWGWHVDQDGNTVVFG